MAAKGGFNDPGRQARALMEHEEMTGRRRMERERQADSSGAPAPRQPRRYKLYDRIKDRVSLTAVNGIIIATVILLVAALIVGIVTGNPTTP